MMLPFVSLSFCLALSLSLLFFFLWFDFCFVSMACRFDFVCDAVPGRTAWRFKVRVARIWEFAGYLKADQINSMLRFFLMVVRIFCSGFFIFIFKGSTFLLSLVGGFISVLI
jgi:hypothetical protein